MKRVSMRVVAPMAAVGIGVLLCAVAARPDFSNVKNVVTGEPAFHSFKEEAPGVYRKITVADLPKPYATEGVSNSPTVVPRPANAWPKAPQGFKVELYADHLDEPRELRTAP